MNVDSVLISQNSLKNSTKNDEKLCLSPGYENDMPENWSNFAREKSLTNIEEYVST